LQVKAWQKLRRKIEASPKNVTEAELARLVTEAGWIEHPSSGTSHRPFKKEGCRSRINVPRTPRGCVRQVYVRAALKAVDECGDADPDAESVEGESV
jgi:hypothetical protein